MPRIDPVTGCSVMTMFEFLDAEAKREGKEPHEIMAEISQTFEDDNKQTVERYKADALNILQADYAEMLKEWESNRDYYTEQGETFDDPAPPEPVEIVQFISGSANSGFRGSGGGFTVKVRCKDGKERYAVFFEWSDPGTRLDPPDGGAEVSYYDEPKLTRAQRKLLNRVNTTFIHRDHWWKEVPNRKMREAIDRKGLIRHDGGRVVLSAIGRIALGLPVEDED